MSQSFRLRLSRNSLKLKVATRIPAQLVGGTGVTITKANGIYTFDLDEDEIEDIAEAAANAAVAAAVGVDIQAYDADLAALAANSTDGLWAHTAAGTGSARTITGTANEITATNGNGVSGNPTLSLPSALTFTGKTVTGGAFAPTSLTLTNATLLASPANPTGTTSGTNVMMGLGVSSCRITTTYGTRLMVTFDGAALNSSTGQTTSVQIRYGTGAGPANGAAVTGTQAGAAPPFGNGGAVYQGGFSKTAIITGLSPATTYWFDLALSVTGGTGSVLGVTFTAMEH